MIKINVLWVTNIPSPYRVDFFNELGKYCNLTVLFERESSSERDQKWGKYNFSSFNGILLKGLNYGVDKAIGLDITKYLKKGRYDHIVISNPLTPTGIISIEYMRVRKISYSIVSDGGFPKNGKGFKEKFKRHILKGANIYFSTASMHDEYYLKYGAKIENIVRYPFTSIKNSDIRKRPMSKSEKEGLKRKLGIREENIILSVGRFTYMKGFDILIEASSNLNKNIGVYIIGGTPSQEFLDLKEKHNLNNIYFEPFKTKEQLSQYFKVADLFVLPTRADVWGLVINEAMAFGLPVITTDKCIAGLELVEDGSNGYIVPINENMTLTSKINLLLDNSELREKMMYSSLNKIRHYTIENMAEITWNILKSDIN